MIYTIGEALIDMIPMEKGKGIKDVAGFYKQAGGAPANVAAAVAKLGGKSAFLGKVGGDGFGAHIREVLAEAGVDVSRLLTDRVRPTAIIYVAAKENGDREFFAMRANSADLYLNAAEIDATCFKIGDILHFCSVDLIEAPVKYAHIKAIESAIPAGALVSFDINLRLMLWDSREKLIATVWDFIKYPDILKVSDDEVKEIFGHMDNAAAAKAFFEKGPRLKAVIVSCGGKGSELYLRNGQRAFQPAFSVKVADTTGAGDCFIGAVLLMIEEAGAVPDITEFTKILRFATAAASLQVMRIGAITSLPTRPEVEEFLDSAVS